MIITEETQLKILCEEVKTIKTKVDKDKKLDEAVNTFNKLMSKIKKVLK